MGLYLNTYATAIVKVQQVAKLFSSFMKMCSCPRFVCKSNYILQFLNMNKVLPVHLETQLVPFPN